ncbi:MAG: hypothetical protein HY323_19570 [Betaproteobacteria bacterium]|nr:hypothetical protein [Betaproteobacteria bacterium]
MATVATDGRLLNPVESLWTWMKRYAMANSCPDTFDEITWYFDNTAYSAKVEKSCENPEIHAARGHA